MRRIFVTGGAGFIGSAFLRVALASIPDCELVNFDALTYAGNPDNLEGLDTLRHRFVRGDITRREEVLAALDDETDAIVNFAAESHVDRSIHSAEDFLRTNITGTQVLIDCARERKVKRFLQVSTDEVMGSLAENSVDCFTEDSPIVPRNPYAASKAAAEHLVMAAHHTFGLDAVITRSGNNYGPRQFPEKFLPLAISNALRDEPVPVYGDGQQLRDWIYVEDHALAILKVLEKGRAGEVYNIGARNERRNLAVAEAVLDALGKPRTLIRHVKDRPGHDRRYAIDPSKIERELGWQPTGIVGERIAPDYPVVRAEYGVGRTRAERRIHGFLRAPVRRGGQKLLRVLVTGAKGLVGRATVSHCEALGDEVHAFDHSQLDIADEKSVREIFESLRPEAVINCAAWTDVDGCELDPERSLRDNALGPEQLARASRDVGARLVTLSTDYVFDGTKEGFYTQRDDPRPQSVYAASKLEGERRAARASARTVVVRTGWVFGTGGRNFLSTVVERAQRGERLAAIEDQWGTPTYA